MSQFFKNFEEDNLHNQPKKPNIKSTQDSNEEEEEKISNKDKKLQELQEEVFRLEESYDGKEIDLFLKNTKKYKSVFKDGLPGFLVSFLNSAIDKKMASGIKNKIKKFLSQNKLQKEESVEVQTSVTVTINKNTDEEDLNGIIIDILKKPGYEETTTELLKLKEAREKVNEKCKICLSVLNLHIKNKRGYYKEVAGLLNEILEAIKDDVKFLEIDFKRYLQTNIDVYLEFLINVAAEEDYDDLRLCFANTKYLNEERVRRKELEFIFYILNQNIETDDKIYHLVYLTRSKLYEEAVEYYNKNEDQYKKYLKIKVELGLLAFETADYLFAYKILQKCYFEGSKEQENLLFILCIILEDDVVDSDFFDIFIDNISIIEDNIFLLKTNSEKSEIFRAYYLLKNGDHSSANEILHRIVPKIKIN